jgi:hypothetical protein
VAERLELSGADAEVWAYEVTVSGELRGGSELKACQVQVADKLSSAELTAAQRFQARVQLSPGENLVQAHCRTRSGARVASATRQYRVRLPASPTAAAGVSSESEAAAIGSNLILDGGDSTANVSTRRPIVRYEWYKGESPEPKASLGKGVRLTLPRPAHRQLYSLRVSDDRGEHDIARVLYRPDGDPGLANDARAALMYGVLPENVTPRCGRS